MEHNGGATRAAAVWLPPQTLLVLRLATDGMYSAEVADSTGLTVEAVRHQLAGVVVALGVRSKLAAVIIALRLGLI